MEAETTSIPEPQVDQSKYPELGARIRSIMIDTLLIMTMMFAATYVLDRFPNASADVHMWIFFFIWLGYEPLAMTFGTTLGNYVMRIRVRNAKNENSRINILQAYLRYAVKLPLGWLAFLTVGGNPKRRALHDLVAGTVMIKV